MRRLLDAIPTETVRDSRDRALIATLTYSFARISAALKMRVEDLRAPRRLGAAAAGKSDRIGSQVGGLPTGSTGSGIV
jgi:site-specific recombinase XerD